MFNIGFTEFLAIGVIALIVIGPKQLPQVARVVGRLLGELKKATEDLSGGILEVTREVKTSIDETRDHVVNEGKKMMDPELPQNDTDDSHSENEKLDGKS